MRKNAIIRTKSGNVLEAEIVINGHLEWDGNPDIGLQRQYRAERQLASDNPANIETITFTIAGKDYCFKAIN